MFTLSGLIAALAVGVFFTRATAVRLLRISPGFRRGRRKGRSSTHQERRQPGEHEWQDVFSYSISGFHFIGLRKV